MQEINPRRGGKQLTAAIFDELLPQVVKTPTPDFTRRPVDLDEAAQNRLAKRRRRNRLAKASRKTNRRR